MKKKLFLCFLLIFTMLALPVSALEGETVSLVSDDSGYKIIVPGFIDIREVEDEFGQYYTAIIMKTPEANEEGEYPIFEIVTTDSDAVMIDSYPGIVNEGQIAGYQGTFDNGRAIYTIDYWNFIDEIKNAEGQLIFLFDFIVTDKDGAEVFNVIDLYVVFEDADATETATDTETADTETTEVDEPSSWAKEEVLNAVSLGLVPESMLNNYTENITRSDFCQLVVQLLAVKENKTFEQYITDHTVDSSINPFTDTEEQFILIANAANIVGGRGNGLFDPNGAITRQEAAVMLMRTAQYLHLEMTIDQSNTFSDDSSIANWAKEAVVIVSLIEDKTNASKLMGGTGNNQFSPTDHYTRQQAFITMKRLFNSF